MNVKTLLAIAFFITAGYTSSAQRAASAARASTIKNDRQRIRQGVKSGELTKAETAKLATQTVKLKNEREAYKADGVVTAAEKKDYKQDKKKVSRQIYRQKHDGQTRR